ncbi:UDP-glucose/GDP-mannose dehydrogenase family protein [Variovorax sp. J22P240]|uniref:UDP-glucose dehydrogenase family protein n=1 Tax=Variovorax sp. J22P240 TaxID=3053514 RepID=UPI002577EEAD|nr:UDP-glucose/GDP-mannose dehydrogenase family protein [Variovorax sp. J22P240]MDL9998095.1 UDP-glucose/GDP-mannose dehydrogenase family protein [Variovorax sp. J22P240]
MKITVFGSGYVGLVTGACLAEVGHDVICNDIDSGKIENLNKGILPIWEPGLEGIVQGNHSQERLHFTCDVKRSVRHGAVQIIAVGTPPDEDGSADLTHVLKVAESIAMHMENSCIVVNKSTVPVGTADKVREKIASTLQKRGVSIPFEVVSNPEFLKEGDAVNDFLKPDRIIVGVNPGADDVRRKMREMYEPFNRNHERIMFMDVRSAELTKYAANAMLATKISFMNELANLSELLEADIEEVRKGIGADPRIGYSFIYPGCGYGGSCFPKDVNALQMTAKGVGFDPKILQAVSAVNDHQKTVLFSKALKQFGSASALRGRKFAVWGLAFKPKTNDMREAPARTLIDALTSAGAIVSAYDPVANDDAQELYSDAPSVHLSSNKYSALEGADALFICTEWQQFKAPDFEEMKDRMSAMVIFDGRNLYSPMKLRGDGWTYHCVGR